MKQTKNEVEVFIRYEEKITRFVICNEELCFVDEISYRMKLPEEYYERYIKLISQLDDRTYDFRRSVI